MSGRRVFALALSLTACFDEFGSFDPVGQGAAAPEEDSDFAAGGASSGGAGQVTGGAAVEACTNGRDDDGDSMADCADIEDCPGHACQPLEVEDGWSGPVKRQLRGANGCDPAYPEPGPSGFAIDDNPCGCSCGEVEGRDCSATLSAFGDLACNALLGESTLAPPSACKSFSAPATLAVTALTTVSGGSCDPLAQPEASFTPVATCALTTTTPSSAGCLPGELCLRPPAPGEVLCVYRAGNEACPTAFEERLLLFQEPLENTACGALDCACGAPTGGDCTGSLELSTSSCGAVVESTTPGQGCQPLSGSIDLASFSYDGQAQGGACGVEVQTDPERFGSPTTLCCQPAT